jgi:hypothetical protein
MTHRTRSRPVCLRHVRRVLLHWAGVFVLFASSALGETIHLGNSDALQSTLLSSSSSAGKGAAKLSGVVYCDEDGDGVLETSDWAVRDAVLALTFAGSNDVLLKAVTSADGSYSFTGLAAGKYTITLLTPSSKPGKIGIGILEDGHGNTVSAGVGRVSGASAVADIVLKDDYQGVNYDFAQLVYPANLISKRMLLNTNPGVHHATTSHPVNPVPEPSAWILAATGFLLEIGFRRRLFGR